MVHFAVETVHLVTIKTFKRVKRYHDLTYSEDTNQNLVVFIVRIDV